MNALLTRDEAVRMVRESLDRHGITKMLAEASPKEREVIWKLLANTFGAGFPIEAQGASELQSADAKTEPQAK